MAKNSQLNIQVGGDHYKNFKIQPIEFITENKLEFIPGCIIKYICRYNKKGTPIEDLKKIIHYTKLLLEFEEKNEKDIAKYWNDSINQLNGVIKPEDLGREFKLKDGGNNK